MKPTKAEKRREIVQDLLIGLGIPILQMVTRECAQQFNINRLQRCNAEYIVSSNRYDIFEDYGPHFTVALTPLVFILMSSWPVAIGTVSFCYCGEYHRLLLLFGVMVHWLQLGPFTRYSSAKVSSGSSWHLPKVSAVACTSA